MLTFKRFKADGTRSKFSVQVLVPESLSRNLDPSFAHQMHKKLVPETWHLTLREAPVFHSRATKMMN